MLYRPQEKFVNHKAKANYSGTSIMGSLLQAEQEFPRCRCPKGEVPQSKQTFSSFPSTPHLGNYTPTQIESSVYC